MSADRYRVEVLHHMNPHLVWVEVIDPPPSQVYEQIGLYGILPLETSIDEFEETVELRKSSEWSPAANLLMTEALIDATDVEFLPAFIDRRTSIFDNNIHTYGEILITNSSGKKEKLSKVLIKANLAVRDEAEFHRNLSSGQLKTKLSHHQIKAVFKSIDAYYIKQETSKDWENAMKDQTRVYQAALGLDKLTVANLELHNRESLKQKYQDLKLCKDIDEPSLRRATFRPSASISDGSVNSNISSSQTMLQRKVELLELLAKCTARKSPEKPACANENDDPLRHVKQKLEDSLRTGLKNSQKSQKTDSEEIIIHNGNTEREKSVKAMKTIEIEEVKKTETKPPSEPPTHFQTTKRSRKPSAVSRKPPPYNMQLEKRIAFGPPELDRSLLPLKVVPKNVFEAFLPETRKDEVPKRVEKDDFDDADSDVGVEIGHLSKHQELIRLLSKNSEVKPGGMTKKADDQTHALPKNTVNQMDGVTKKTEGNNNNGTATGVPDVKSQGIPDIPSSSSKTPGSSKKRSLLDKLQILKRASSQEPNSDSSSASAKNASFNTDAGSPSSKNVEELMNDSDEETMSELVKKLEAEYAAEAVSPETATKPDTKTTQKQYANPFRNVDPDISVFVEKLVTPVLMVHSDMNVRFQPSFLMRDVCFDTQTKIALKNMGVESPMTIQTMSWFCVLRGFSLIMVGARGCGKTVGYLPAVCRLLSVVDAGSIADCVGPSCIIVCATAISVAEVERLARVFCGGKKQVRALYTGMSDLDLTTCLLNGCDLMITTPSILFRLLQSTDLGIDLRKLTTFVLDDCERLSEVYGTEIVFFQRKIKEMLKSRVPKEMKVQFVVASRVWCDFMQPFARAAPSAVVCIGAFQECVLYSKAKTTASFVTKENKDSSLLEFLSEIDASKKTVIFCREDEEVRHLQKVLAKSKRVVVACDNTMDVLELQNLIQTLEDSVSDLILVCCDGNMAHLNVADAHHLVHYSLPPLFSLFCKRFSVLNENYASIFKNENEDVRIKILLEESNMEQLPKILHFIKRCTSTVPEVLDEICDRVRAEKDAVKAKQCVPVCDSLLALGSCPDIWNCQERHAVLKEYDEPKEWMPTAGEITFKILHYHTAVCYSARLLANVVNGNVTKYQQTYSTLSTKMSMYFATESNRKLHGIPEIGDICAVSIKENFFVRCQVVKILSRYESGNPNGVLIRLIDEEKLERSRDIYLYYLPEGMKNTETHTIQVRLAGVQPKDKDITFSRLASDHLKAITNADEELYLKGRVVLAIGNSVFVETLETYKDLTYSGSVVRHDLKQELLSRFAKINPEHVTKLMKLRSFCRDAKVAETGKQEKENIRSIDAPKPDKELPEIKWAYLEEGELSQTVLAFAIDPGTFFVRLVKFEDLMTGLLNDIQAYVAQHPASVSSVAKNDLVLAKYPDDEKYERARIDEVLGEKVKCFFVDTGDWEEIALSDLAPIPDVFITRLPFQAIECRLFGVRPPGESWTDFANVWLTNCLNDNDSNPKLMYLRRYTSEAAEFTGGHKYAVAVIDTNGDFDVVINQAMVKVNLAKENAQEMKILDESNLLKTVPIESESEDDDWEKVPEPVHELPEKSVVPSNDLVLKQPIRSVPLVGSDDEFDEDDFDFHMHEDFLELFGGALGDTLRRNWNNQRDKGSDWEAGPRDATQFRAITGPPCLNDDQPSKLTIDNQKDSEIDAQGDDDSLIGSSLSNVRVLSADTKSLDSDDMTSPDQTAIITDLDLEPIATKVIPKMKELEPIVTNEVPNTTATKMKEVEPKDEEPKPMIRNDISDLRDKTENTRQSMIPNEDPNPVTTKQTPKPEEPSKPKVCWKQNKENVCVKIQLVVDKYEMCIEGKRLKFSAYANDTNYGFEIELYGGVDLDKCRHDNKGQYILVNLTKVLKKNWLSLTKNDLRLKWIAYDVDGLDVSESEEEGESNMAAEAMRHFRHDSDTEDDDFVDDLGK